MSYEKTSNEGVVMPRIPKKYTIEGQEFSARSLADEIGCTSTSAKNRLIKCNTLAEVYAPLRKKGGGMIAKNYTIQDKTLTIQQLAKELNCSITSARSRIQSAKTLEELYVPIMLQDGNAHARRSLNKIDPELIKLNKLLYSKW